MTWYLTFFSVGILSFIAGVNWEGQKHSPEDWWAVTFMLVGIFFIVFIGGVLDGY